MGFLPGTGRVPGAAGGVTLPSVTAGGTVGAFMPGAGTAGPSLDLGSASVAGAGTGIPGLSRFPLAPGKPGRLDLGVSGFSGGAGSGVTGTGGRPGFGMGTGGTVGFSGTGMGLGGTAGWSGTGMGTGGTLGGTTGGISGAGTGGLGGRGFSSPGAGGAGGVSGDCALARKGKARAAKARWIDRFMIGEGDRIMVRLKVRDAAFHGALPYFQPLRS